jgi:nucleotide-binding universal stress UspA family protein
VETPLFKKILFPIQFDRITIPALEMVTHMARHGDRFVYLLCVIPEDTADIRQVADNALRGVAHNWLDGKIPHETIVRIGKPAAEIVKLEEELDVDLVVMATHGRTGEKYEKLGSVTEQVVRDSTRPVLTIRPT